MVMLCHSCYHALCGEMTDKVACLSDMAKVGTNHVGTQNMAV